MKKLVLFITILCVGACLIAAQTMAAQVISGSSVLKDRNFDSLQVNGALEFNNLIVDDLLEVNGSISGKNLKCRDLKSNGSLHIEVLRAHNIEGNGSFEGKNIEVTEQAKINGYAKITDGKLNIVEIASFNSVFVNTKVIGNIVIKKTDNGFNLSNLKSKDPKVQILELKDDSVISGNITFEAEGGEVHLFDSSKVYGKVLNGKVIKN